jgi:hypothetical protein
MEIGKRYLKVNPVSSQSVESFAPHAANQPPRSNSCQRPGVDPFLAAAIVGLRNQTPFCSPIFAVRGPMRTRLPIQFVGRAFRETSKRPGWGMRSL